MGQKELIEDLSVEEYIPEEDALVTAALDFQKEFDDFIPFDDEVTIKINKELKIK